MTTRSVSMQKAEIEEPAVSSNADKPEYDLTPHKTVAFYLNPACEHDWSKLSNELQTLEIEGKIIWKCSTCAEITNTYDWQKP